MVVHVVPSVDVHSRVLSHRELIGERPSADTFLYFLGDGACVHPSPSAGDNLVCWGVVSTLLLRAHVAIFLTNQSYLEQISPKDWGNQRPFYFPLLTLYHLIKKPNRGLVDLPPDALAFEESDDCAAERERARDIENPKYVMNCINVRKQFGSKIAVHAMSLAIENEETFGLLGPNGAGKTTRTLVFLPLRWTVTDQVVCSC